MGLDAGYGIGSLKPGVCTSSTRPAAPYVGQTIFETDTGFQKTWLGSNWSNGYKHFVGITVEYLVIAGGGGGGSNQGGGGGAGGYLTATNFIASPATTYTVTVGGGGAGGTSIQAGTT